MDTVPNTHLVMCTEPADEPIRIVSYDPSWPTRFQHEKTLLERAIGAWITGGVHHVGSTAVSGLAAKPVIDILVGVHDLVCSRDCFGKSPVLRRPLFRARVSTAPMSFSWTTALRRAFFSAVMSLRTCSISLGIRLF